MKEIFKSINKALRILFIGFVGIYAIAKLIGAAPDNPKRTVKENKEHVTSEFDEIW